MSEETGARVKRLNLLRTPLEITVDEPSEFVEPDAGPTVRRLVFEALGAASMCWEHIADAGVFQSERAAEIGEGLIEELRDLFGTEPL